MFNWEELDEEALEKCFKEKLNAKTGWGRNEILEAYKESVNEALLEIIDKVSF